MSSLLVKNIVTEFLSLSWIDDYRHFFARYDIMILTILFIKMQNKVYWWRLWHIIYELQKADAYELFFQNLKKNNLSTQSDFVDYMNSLYVSVVSNKWFPFYIEYDLSIVFSDENLDDLLCICRKITIHSWQEVKEFTQETCIESLYFYRATRENKYYEHITFNQMMRDVCVSLLDFLDEIE